MADATEYGLSETYIGVDAVDTLAIQDGAVNQDKMAYNTFTEFLTGAPSASIPNDPDYEVDGIGYFAIDDNYLYTVVDVGDGDFQWRRTLMYPYNP